MNYRKKEKKRKEDEKHREEIILSLPSFINQLLLLMDSGLILNDAFKRVALEYRRTPLKNRNYFAEKVITVYEESEKTGEGVINGFYSFACREKVKELTKTANFLYENKNRGTELYKSLSELSEGLWEERKRLCMEKIRKSELKMSFPLGIMLISLIIMTAAPALMQIN